MGHADWAFANGAAAALANGQCSLTDQSSPGDWRLPTKDEWSATITRAVALGCILGASPSLTNDAGTGCLSGGFSSFAGVASEDGYWSSTSVETFLVVAWYVDVFNGRVPGFGKADSLLVWPVRGGPR